MKVETFTLERWMSTWETVAKFDIAESGVYPLTTRELLDFLPSNERHAAEEPVARSAARVQRSAWHRPTADATWPRPTKMSSPDQILVTTGAIEANYLLVNTLLEAGDHVVAVFPAYQQLYSVPRRSGATIDLWKIVEDGGQLPLRPGCARAAGAPQTPNDHHQHPKQSDRGVAFGR